MKKKKSIFLCTCLPAAVVVAGALMLLCSAVSALPINVGDTWRYFKGTSEPPANWNELGFDETTWFEGATGIGFGFTRTHTYATTIDDMYGGYASLYARHRFTIADLSSLKGLELGVQYDDGFIAYINGIEVARSRTMTQSSYAHDEGTGNGHNESLPEEVFVIKTADIPSLVEGENVLAIQTHNFSLYSKDACIVPRLTGLSSIAPTAVISADNTRANVQPPLTVNFSGAGSSDDGSIVDYQWDFGDGQQGTGAQVAHTYTEEGVFVSTLTVFDNEGLTGSDSLKIFIGVRDYEGFGSITRGALDSPTGYQVYHVTHLGDSGTGSFRDAVSKGSRYIVFDVGGTINLGYLRIEKPYLTIDGSTAPSPGITLLNDTGFKAAGGAHDVIIHNIRGDGGHTPPAAGGPDMWAIDAMVHVTIPIYNIIVDHCTFTSAMDGVFDTRGMIEHVTYSWNLFKDTEAMGSFSDMGYRKGISFHHNVLAHGGKRMPKIKNESGSITTNFDLVNNIVYSWGTWNYLYDKIDVRNEGLRIDTPGLLLELHVTNNWYEPAGGLKRQAVIMSLDGTQVDFEGNVFPEEETEDVDTGVLPPPIPEWARVTTYDASALGDTVVPFVGTHYPTQEEMDLLNEISHAIGGNPLSPRVSDIPDQTIGIGGSFSAISLDEYVEDSDHADDQLVWSCTGQTELVVSIVNRVASVAVSAGWTGAETVRFIAQDPDGLTGSNTVKFTVQDEQSPGPPQPPEPEPPVEPEAIPTKTEMQCCNNVLDPSKGEEATITVALDREAQVTVVIYDNKGREIKKVMDEQKQPGFYSVKWNGTETGGNPVGSGIYLVHIEAGGYAETKKIAVIK